MGRTRVLLESKVKTDISFSPPVEGGASASPEGIGTDAAGLTGKRAAETFRSAADLAEGKGAEAAGPEGKESKAASSESKEADAASPEGI